MSTPPPGGWPPPQQPGQPPSQGQPFGQSYDPSGYNPQQPPPPGWQQGAWTPHSAPPPQSGNSLKWLLIGVAVLLVVAISVGATLLFTRDGNGGSGTGPRSSAPSDIASANDTGPIAVITDEPTCNAFYGINTVLADVQANGWGAQRATLGPEPEWTDQQRTLVQAVATATQNAADRMVNLAKQTPHRVVRELYEQFTAYGRAYADSTSRYVPTDDFYADVNVSVGNAILGICNSIENGSANRALSLASVNAPSQRVTPPGPGESQRFLLEGTSSCGDWNAIDTAFTAGTNEWEKLDSNVAASQWTAEQRATQQAALLVMKTSASDMESTGRQSGNPVLEDFSVLAALYLRAYVSSNDTYTGSDSWLVYTALRLNNAISSACKAVM